MTAPVRSSVAILPEQPVAPGTSNRWAPALVGGWVNVQTFNGGVVGVSVKNGASPPSIQGQFALQMSDAEDGTNVFDVYSAGGNITAGADVTFTIPLPAEAKFVRLICYGNTVNPVTFKATLFAKA